jgi:hypothetical protein
MYKSCKIILTDLIENERKDPQDSIWQRIPEIFPCGLAERNCDYATECRIFIEQNREMPNFQDKVD